MNAGESKNAINLANARNIAKQIASPMGKAKLALSLHKKLYKHKWIILAALIFDVFGLIPIIGIGANFTFGVLLFLYFGSKKGKNGSSNLLGIAMPILLGSALDWILSFLPVNTAAVLIRIGLSEE